MTDSEAECKSCMAVSMSLGLSLVLEYVYATPEVKQPDLETPDPLPLVPDSNKARGSAPTRQKKYRNRLRENQEDHLYKCLFCQEVFSSRYDRNAHQKCHQKEDDLKEFRCAWMHCSRGFETELNMVKHQRIMGHHNWKDSCWRCKLLFPNSQSLMAHTKSKRCDIISETT